MAFTNPTQGNPNASALRKQAGRYVKQLREAAELTQNELAQRINWPYYTMISQIESGRTRIPPDKIADYAKALGVNQREFAKKLLSYYDPYMWVVLFGNEAQVD